MVKVDIKPVLDAVIDSYVLPVGGLHGVTHWARVLENGLKLAEVTGADANVVALFAVLHDSQRINEHLDPGHGPRAAHFATEIRGKAFDLSDEEFTSLCFACDGHTRERHHPNITIQTCWDADRLDFGRTGVTPHPHWLGTEEARRRETLDWAHGRARCRIVPDLVRNDWKLDVSQLG